METIELKILDQGTSSTLRAIPGLGLNFSLALGPENTLSSSTFLANSNPSSCAGFSTREPQRRRLARGTS